MLTRLPESNAQRQRRLGGLTVSTAVHLLVIGLAVHASGWTATTPVVVEPLPPLAFVEPMPVQPSAPMTARASTTARSSDRQFPQVPPLTVAPLGEISADIPLPGTMHDITRNDDFHDGRVAGADGAFPGSAPNVAGGAPLTDRFVDKAVIAIPGTTTPRYPSTLQSAGIEGDVRAQFVVDTLGHVEPGSVRILDATHDLFARAVRDALVRARFAPAEAGGRKVRQLAEQVFTFRIGSRD